MKAKAYCKCGAKLHVSCDKPEVVEFTLASFWEIHQGKGHGSATAKEAAKARRVSEKEMLS